MGESHKEILELYLRTVHFCYMDITLTQLQIWCFIKSAIQTGVKRVIFNPVKNYDCVQVFDDFVASVLQYSYPKPECFNKCSWHKKIHLLKQPCHFTLLPQNFEVFYFIWNIWKLCISSYLASLHQYKIHTYADLHLCKSWSVNAN